VSLPAFGATSGHGAVEQICQYRAKATILMLSVPVLVRDNVGSGYLRVVEGKEQGKRKLSLEFGAGSEPDRAAGLNRLGVFEESIVTVGDQLESALYFGFMTSSTEQDIGEARTALHGKGTTAFTAIRGRIASGVLSNWLLHIRDLQATCWADREQLTADIRARLTDEACPQIVRATTPLRDAPCCPFLYTVSSAMRSAQDAFSGDFVHNGKRHVLRTECKPCGPADLARLDGRIISDAGKEISSFRLWFHRNQPSLGPSRFEFQPRSFLRLTFERV
jgi:hypothetical protein